MPGTNLDFNITAKTGAAIADLKLLQAEMRNVGRQVNAAVKTGDTAGARALADTFGVMGVKVAGLKKELNGTTEAMNSFSVASTRTLRSLFSVQGSVATLTKNLVGLRAGLAASVVGIGVEKLLANLDEVDKRMRDIRDALRETGQKPIVTQAAQEIAGQVGEKPEVATKMLASFGAAFAKAQVAGQSAADATGNLNSEIQQGVQVFRGASPIVLDLAKAYETLGLQLARYKGDAAGQEKAFLDAGKPF